MAKWIVLCTGPSLTEYEDEIKELMKKRTSIGVHNMAGRFEPQYNLFTSRKRYNKYWKNISPKTIAVLSEKMEERHTPYLLLKIDNKYPSKNGSLEIHEDRIVAEGAVGGTVAVGYAIMRGATDIVIAGMDGYSGGSTHFYPEKMNNHSRLMEHESATPQILRALSKHARIRIITPTVYEEFYENLFDNPDD